MRSYEIKLTEGEAVMVYFNVNSMPETCDCYPDIIRATDAGMEWIRNGKLAKN